MIKQLAWATGCLLLAIILWVKARPIAIVLSVTPRLRRNTEQEIWWHVIFVRFTSVGLVWWGVLEIYELIRRAIT